MKTIINIAIAEDHTLVRQGIVNLLKEFEGINILFDVSNGLELLDRLEKTEVDIVLLDIEMPVMNGKEALKIMKHKYPEVKTIILSSHFDDSYILEFVTAGASGFLPKNLEIDQLVDAIHAVYSQGYYFDSKVSILMAQSLIENNKKEKGSDEANLTHREREILEMICKDFTTREIAEKLDLSVRTIEGYRKSIMDKTHSKNPMGLLQYAIKHQIVKMTVQ